MDSQSLYDFLISKDGFQSKFTYSTNIKNPTITDIPSIIPSYWLNTLNEKLWFYGGNIQGWKEIGNSSDGETIVKKSTDFYATENTTYLVDTSSNTVKITIPSGISYPYKFRIIDLKNTSPISNITVDFITNGYKLEGNSINYTINSNSYMYEFIATESNYGFKSLKIMSTTPSITNDFSIGKAYVKAERCYWFGVLAEANDTIPYGSLFAWGTSGTTWKPVSMTGNWRGVYIIGNSYKSGDLIVTYNNSGSIFKFIGSDISAGDSSYNPNTGINRDKWIPANFDGSNLMEGATDTLNGRQGYTPTPKVGDNKKFLRGDAQYASPFFVGEIKTTAILSVYDGWLKCDGSAISRITYSDLFSAIGTTYGSGNGSTTFNIPNFNGRTPVGAGQLLFNTSFSYTDVNITTDVITVLADNTLYTGTPITITTNGTIPTGLVVGTTYYVIKLTPTTIKLATTSANALNGTAINITTQGTGIHTLTYTGANRTLGSIGGEENHVNTIQELVPHTHGYNSANALNVGTVGSTDAADNIYGNTGSTGSGMPTNNMQPYIVLNYLIKY